MYIGRYTIHAAYGHCLSLNLCLVQPKLFLRVVYLGVYSWLKFRDLVTSDDGLSFRFFFGAGVIRYPQTEP